MVKMIHQRRDTDRMKELPAAKLRDWIAGHNPLSKIHRVARSEMDRRRNRDLLVLWGVSAALAVGFFISYYL